jgi:hypothetical protein
MSTARRICSPTIAGVLLALAMTGAAAASASQQDLRSPDARDAAAGRGTFTSRDVNSPQMFTDRQRVVVTRFKRSPSYQQALREAITAVKPPQPAPVRADDGIDWQRRWHRRREPTRRDRPRARGRHDDPAAQAPGAPNGDCRLTPRAHHRRERGAGMSSPAPRRDAVRRHSRRKAQSTEPVSITPAADEDQERRGRLPLVAKEQSWRTAWSARSLLSWTTCHSAHLARCAIRNSRLPGRPREAKQMRNTHRPKPARPRR